MVVFIKHCIISKLSVINKFFFKTDTVQAPGRAFWLLWVHILGPYFMQKAPEAPPELNEKKQKKLERRMKRQQNR